MPFQNMAQVGSAIERLNGFLDEMRPLLESLSGAKSAIDESLDNKLIRDLATARSAFTRIRFLSEEIIMMDPEEFGNPLVQKIAANITLMAKETLSIID